jgi:hypothetical protein
MRQRAHNLNLRQTSMSSHLSFVCIRSYKAAIALSNTGVGLLERNRFSDAMATLKGALDLMRSAFPQNDQECQQVSQSKKEAEIYHLLNQASQRLARPLSAEEKRKALLELPFSLTVLPDDQSPKAVLHTISEIASSHDAFAIRIDDSKTCDDSKFLDVDSAIILMNYGTASRCHAATISPACPRLLHGSFRYFHLAFGVISHQPALVINESDDIEAIRLLLVLTLVMQNLMQLSWQMKKPHQAQSYHHKLCHLRVALLRLEKIPRLSVSRNRAAPSA